MSAATLHANTVEITSSGRPKGRRHLSFIGWLRLVSSALLTIAAVTNQVAHADLILTAPPRESAAIGKKIYTPLAQGLSRILKQRVVYVHPSDWRSYEKNMKKDKYDIIFDGPHFAAWRIESLRARPLVKLNGNLRFVLVSLRSDLNSQRTEQLIGLPVCTLPSPNLGALSLFAMFPHPARQPEYRMILHGGFKEVANALRRGECNAAILRSSFYYKKADKDFRDQTRVIQRSTAMTNQGITLSKRIPQKWDRLISNFLTSKSSAGALKPLLDRFTNSKGNFIVSSEHDYEGQNLLHDNVIFGW